MDKSILQSLKAAVAAVALISIAPFAAAQTSPPKVKDVAISQDFQKKLEKDYGVREAARLKEDVQRVMNRSLSKAGQTKVAWVNVTISDARPNRPTFEQLSRNTSLSYLGSLSTGGAKIEATLYDASGAALGTVTHKWYSSDLQSVTVLDTWGDANRAFDSVAYKIRKEAERDI